jgi:outer membrane receptor protein involved in Fe transport
VSRTEYPSMSRFAHRLVTGALALLCATRIEAQSQTAAAELSLDSLLNTRISAAAKYSQTSAEAAASVTIVTSDDIRLYGYRNFQDLLESVRGLYITNDRNYVYLGARGFSRPSDYNNRILLLVDGHTVNEQIWGGAPIGADLAVNLEAIERVEIVRGPGSALYGTSAMFAVVNVVTKSGTDLNGVSVSGRVGTGDLREGTVVGGGSIGTRGSFSISGLLRRSEGRTLYFPEFDAPETNYGIVSGQDWDETVGALATVAFGGLTGRAGYTARTKGIPTGSYEMNFADPRAQTADEYAWADLGLRRAMGTSLQLSVRLYGDRYYYRGVSPDGEGVFTDFGNSFDLGNEVMLVWDQASRHRVTLGTEVRRVFQAEYRELWAEGDRFGDDAPFTVASVFAQDELQLHRRLTLVSGLRFDKRSRVQHALTPRVALIATPDASTTVKLLYGEAFRAPGTAEADLNTSFYFRNPDLNPERIRTLELEVQRRVHRTLLLGASVYDYGIRDLIEQVSYEDGHVDFRNVASSHGRGVEVQADLVTGGPFSGHVAYELQRTEDEATGSRLSNSPSQTWTLGAAVRSGTGVHSALSLRHEAGRQTLGGSSTPAFTRTDFNVGYAVPSQATPSWMTGTTISFRASNLFDTHYSTPGGFEHRQESIAQDGRSLSIRLGLTF